MTGSNRFWSFRADGQDAAELMLYGDIAEWSWWGDDITPKKFNRDLANLGAGVKNLTVRINSYGGDVFAAHAIYNSLRQHPARVTVRIDGIAASAATIVMLAGDEIVMPENAMIMVHNPWTVAVGDSREMRQMADTLDQVRASMLAVYESRTGMSRTELIELMDVETWMTAAEAVERGFADTLEQNKRVSTSLAAGRLIVNGLSLNLDRMRMVPAALLPGSAVEDPTPRSGEDITAAASGEQTNEEVVMSDNVNVTQVPEAAEAAEAVVAPAAEPAVDATDAVAVERERVKALSGLMGRFGEEFAGVIDEAIDSGATLEATVTKIVMSDRYASAQALAARAADSAAASGVSPQPAGSGEDALADRAAKMAAVGQKHLAFCRGGKK